MEKISRERFLEITHEYCNLCEGEITGRITRTTWGEVFHPKCWRVRKAFRDAVIAGTQAMLNANR